MNIKFEYLYRDAGNYKSWGEVVFMNPSAIALTRIEMLLRLRLIDGQYFVAHDVRLPNLYSSLFDPELDHGWHEFSCVEETDEPPNDILGRTIEEFALEIGRSFELVKN